MKWLSKKLSEHKIPVPVNPELHVQVKELPVLAQTAFELQGDDWQLFSSKKNNNKLDEYFFAFAYLTKELLK